jgi:hypothetical protein
MFRRGDRQQLCESRSLPGTPPFQGLTWGGHSCLRRRDSSRRSFQPSLLAFSTATPVTQKAVCSVITVYIEMTVEKGIAMALTSPARQFILHSGEIGSRLAVNRTVAQEHVLLYLSAEPLSVPRSNVSASLREFEASFGHSPIHFRDRPPSFSSAVSLRTAQQIARDGICPSWSACRVML